MADSKTQTDVQNNDIRVVAYLSRDTIDELDATTGNRSQFIREAIETKLADE